MYSEYCHRATEKLRIIASHRLTSPILMPHASLPTHVRRTGPHVLATQPHILAFLTAPPYPRSHSIVRSEE